MRVRLDGHARSHREGEAWAGAPRSAASERGHRQRPGRLRKARRELEAGALQRPQAPAGRARAVPARGRRRDAPRAGGVRRRRPSTGGDRAPRALGRQCGDRVRGRGRLSGPRHRLGAHAGTRLRRVHSRHPRGDGTRPERQPRSVRRPAAACSASSSCASKGRRRSFARRCPRAASAHAPSPAPSTSAPADTRATWGGAAPRRRGARRGTPPGH